MSWLEFKKYINTREKYLAFVKKNLKMAPIPIKLEGKFFNLIDSIDKGTYDKEFERIKANYSKLIVSSVAKTCAIRKGKTRGGKTRGGKTRGGRKKKRKTKKIQKGGFDFSVLVLFICLGATALSCIGSCIIDCGCCKPCGILPSDEKIWGKIAKRSMDTEIHRKQWDNAKFSKNLGKTIKRYTGKNGRRRSTSSIRVTHVSNPEDDPSIVLAYDGVENPTDEDKKDLETAKRMAQNASYYSEGDLDGWVHADFLEQMRNKYKDKLHLKNTNPVPVLKKSEYDKEERQNKAARQRSYFDDDGRKGSFSPFGRGG